MQLLYCSIISNIQCNQMLSFAYSGQDERHSARPEYVFYTGHYIHIINAKHSINITTILTVHYIQ